MTHLCLLDTVNCPSAAVSEALVAPTVNRCAPDAVASQTQICMLYHVSATWRQFHNYARQSEVG